MTIEEREKYLEEVADYASTEVHGMLQRIGHKLQFRRPGGPPRDVLEIVAETILASATILLMDPSGAEDDMCRRAGELGRTLLDLVKAELGPVDGSQRS